MPTRRPSDLFGLGKPVDKRPKKQTITRGTGTLGGRRKADSSEQTRGRGGPSKASEERFQRYRVDEKPAFPVVAAGIDEFFICGPGRRLERSCHLREPGRPAQRAGRQGRGMADAAVGVDQIGRASGREDVSVGVYLGGRSSIKNKTYTNQ